MAVVVEDDIERLGIGTELGTLEPAPLCPDGAQRLGVAVGIGHLIGLAERRLVVDIERDEHEVVGEHIGHGRIGPYGCLHLTAVHATEAGEVDEYRLAQRLGSGHARFVVGVFGLYHLIIKVEVLRVHRRGEGADGLAWSPPESGHHIEGEGQRHQSAHDADHRHRLMELAAHLVALEFEPATEVGTQESEDDNPQREEHLTVEQMPAIGEIGHGEELQGEGQFDETQHNLQRVHPRPRLRRLFQPGREEGEEREGQGQRQGESEHAEGRCQPVAAGGGLYEQQADDGGRA